MSIGSGGSVGLQKRLTLAENDPARCRRMYDGIEEGLGGAQPGEAVERVTAEVMGVPGETGPVSTHTYVMACDRHAEGERGGSGTDIDANGVA